MLLQEKNTEKKEITYTHISTNKAQNVWHPANLNYDTVKESLHKFSKIFLLKSQLTQYF